MNVIKHATSTLSSGGRVGFVVVGGITDDMITCPDVEGTVSTTDCIEAGEERGDAGDALVVTTAESMYSDSADVGDNKVSVTAVSDESLEADEDTDDANDALDDLVGTGDGTTVRVENIGLGIAEEISTATSVDENATLSKETSDIVTPPEIALEGEADTNGVLVVTVEDRERSIEERICVDAIDEVNEMVSGVDRNITEASDNEEAELTGSTFEDGEE